MTVDFHTHIFPDNIAERAISGLEISSNAKAFTNGTLSGLKKQMDSVCDIAVSLPVLTKPSQFESVLNFALDINKIFYKSNRGVISFAGIHPACDNLKEKMQTIKNAGFLGVKIHPDYQDAFIDDERYYQILKLAKDLDLIVVAHAGIDDAFKNKPVRCPPELSFKVVKKINYDKFILAHLGAREQWNDVYKFLAGENVLFDTAFTFGHINDDLFRNILEKHGEDKILFATDCPWHEIYKDKNYFLSYGFNKQTEEKILYKNAIKLLKIKV